jgi:Bacterial regulatory protein, Fis family
MTAVRTKLSDLERDHILRTLGECHGNRTRAAKLLGISVRGLRMKLASYVEAGYSVPPPALHRPDMLVADASCAGHKLAIGAPAPRPKLNGHVQRQLGLSLRIFYDGIVCAPLPETFVALATKLDHARRFAGASRG